MCKAIFIHSSHYFLALSTIKADKRSDSGKMTTPTTRKKYDTTFLTVAGISLILLLFFAITTIGSTVQKSPFDNINSNNSSPVASSTSGTYQAPAEDQSITYAQGGNPLTKHPNYTSIEKTTSIVTTKDNHIIIGEEQITFTPGMYQPITETCDFTQGAHNICSIGSIATGNMKGSVFAVANIQSNLWWKNTTNIKNARITGSVSIIGQYSETNQKFILISLNETNTGVAILLNDDTEQDIETLLNTVTVSTTEKQ